MGRITETHVGVAIFTVVMVKNVGGETKYTTDFDFGRKKDKLV